MGTAAGQNLATALGGHARAVAMATLAHNFTRLKGALHGLGSGKRRARQGSDAEKSRVSKHWGRACQRQAGTPVKAFLCYAFCPLSEVSSPMSGRNRPLFGNIWRLVSHSLSGRLLLFTLLYVLVSEVLIFVPTMGRYHRQLLENHVQAAELAVLPFTDEGGGGLTDNLRRELLERAQADAVLLKRAEQWQLFLVGGMPENVDKTIDLSRQMAWGDMLDAMDCLFNGGNRVLHVLAPTRVSNAQSIWLILNEAPIRADMLTYAGRTIMTSLFLSVMTAILVFVSLYFIFVRPMARLTGAMVAFRENPEDASRIIAPSNRRDEIGVAERELATMQRDLYNSLQQKTRLAALGAAIARIQHDLRNMLSNAQLASDRLAALDDPMVKRLAPRLVTAIDHAVALATRTLQYGRTAEPTPERRPLALAPLIEEATEAALAPMNSGAKAYTNIDARLFVNADSEQLFRIILNLVRNAAEAIARCQGRDGVVQVDARRQGAATVIDITDNGPGVPAAIRDSLFKPFSTQNKDGSGLGLAIARELARAHGGDVTLHSTSDKGSVFRVTIPDVRES